jgi:hypothetical protein
MPPPTPNIKSINDTKHIFCIIRKKWIVLTPEEKVRQFILHQLIEQFHYLQKYISVEKTLKVNNLSKRYDIVVYNRQLQAKILIECKAEHINLQEKTLQQIATYNLAMQVPFLMVTNGQKSYYFQVREDNAIQINQLPNFEEL